MSAALILVPDILMARLDFLGLPLWKRGWLTCQQAGIKQFIVVSGEREFLQDLRFEVEKDKRFDCSWTVVGSGDALPAVFESFICLDADEMFDLELLKDPTTLCPADEFPPALVAFLKGEANDTKDLRRKGILTATLQEAVTAPDYFLGRVETRSDLAKIRTRLFARMRSRQISVFDRWVHSALALPLLYFFLKTPITPNQITLLSVPFAGAALYLFARGGQVCMVLGALSLVATAVLDCCDGAVARLKFQTSRIGDRLDLAMDNVVNLSAFVEIALGYPGPAGWWVFGLLAMILVGGMGVFGAVYLPNPSLKGSAFRGTVLERMVLLLINRDFIYIILLLALLGRVHWFLWIAAVGANLFALVLLGVRFVRWRKGLPA